MSARRRSPRSRGVAPVEQEAPIAVASPEAVPLAQQDTAESTWRRKLLVRCSVGLVMIAGFFTLVLSNHWVVSAFVLAVQAMSFRELMSVRYKVAKERAIPLFRFLNWFAFLMAQWLVYGKHFLTGLMLDHLEKYHMIVSFVMFALFFTAFVLSLRKGYYKYQMTQLAWSTLVISLVVGQAVGSLFNIFQGLFWFMLPSSLIVANDIWAYFCGLFFGRKFIKRPFLALSPNKTWEGFIGGSICALIMCPIMVYLYSRVDFWVCPEASMDATYHCVRPLLFQPKEYVLFGLNMRVAPVYFHSLVLAVFASLIAPFGGFFASGVKRAFNKKEFDNIFPGHGGVVDRMDCQMITQLFTYVYLKTWVVPAAVGVDAVIALAAQLATEDKRLLLSAVQKMIGI